MQKKHTKAEDFLGRIVRVTVDRPLGSRHPKHADIIYEINYGYVAGTLSPDGAELDAYILGMSKPVENFEGRCIAILRRLKDDDDKLIIVPDGTILNEMEIRAAVSFQEKFFDSNIIFS